MTFVKITDMALRSCYLLTTCLQNCSKLVSPAYRPAVHARRQFSSVINQDKQSCVSTDFQLFTALQREGTKPRKNIHALLSEQIRSYAKKVKGKKVKGKKDHIVTDEPEDFDVETFPDIVYFEKLKEGLQKALDHLRDQYIHELALKTTAGAFDRILVETEDGQFPLNQIATIHQKGQSLIILNLYQHVKYMADVMKALHNCGMNVNPQQEGQATIYLAINKVSYEDRQKLAKNAKVFYNQAKAKMDKLYTQYSNKINKDASFDLKSRFEKMLYAEKIKVQHQAEMMMKAKQEELLG